jgi:hypothetical protein
MTLVNWERKLFRVEDHINKVSEPLGSMLRQGVAELANGWPVYDGSPTHQVLFHDSKTKTGLKRVLDDSPKEEWEVFFNQTQIGNLFKNIKGLSKRQNDGSVLMLVKESYCGGFMPSERYFLLKEV